MKRNTLLALLLVETAIIILGVIRYSTDNFKGTESSQESLENSRKDHVYNTVRHLKQMLQVMAEERVMK